MGIDDFTIRHFRDLMFNDVKKYFEEKQEPDKKEYIYDSNLGRINKRMCKIRVYSSIDTRSERVRDEGTDAIRVNIIDKYNNAFLLNNERYRHIKRTSGWNERVLKRINKYTSEFPNNISYCPECSSPLQIKDGPYGNFVCCSGWSAENDCDYTKSL